jgi:integrase/recombinase XerD
MPPRQGTKKKALRVIGDVTDPDGFGAWIERYLEWLRVRNYSPRTVGNAASYLGLFVAWCEARSLGRPRELTKPILERYQRHLFHLRKANGRALTFRSQRVRLQSVRGFFKWLTRQNALPSNPASELELPRMPERLPRAVLTAEESERVLSGPDVSEPLGVRDRAILEVLYSTGIRRMELVNLKIFDVDAERGTVMVREGKGKRDRMIPIGERALGWVERYASEVRPSLVVPPDAGVLFLTSLGEALTPDWLTQRVRAYVLDSGIGKTGSCHLFRHTMATLMLENGADVRFIQEMLGHKSLESTQVYTRVSIRKLVAIHRATHPAAAEQPLQERAKASDTAETADELFSRLAAEDGEETADSEARQ